VTGIRAEDFIGRAVAGVAFYVTLAVVGVGGVGAQDSGSSLPLFAPAELERSLRLPGMNDPIQRPMALHVDRRHGEIFVGDTGANRIVIFDRDGLYRYQFGCADHIGSPQGVVVDSEGHVFVLGTSRQGQRLVQFDFDGMYLDTIELAALDLPRIHGIACDEEDRLLLVGGDANVHVIGRDGRRVHRIDVATAVGDGDRDELLLGEPSVRDGELWIPVSNLGLVLAFDVESGDLLRSVGIRGNTPGQLNFPVAVDVTSHGIVAVLDKMRFAVVCYSTDGRFLGEFGGKGFRDGWFYHPSLLAVSDDDHVVVGQMLEGRIQLCRVPGYVRTRLVQASTTRQDEEDEEERVARGSDASGATLREP